MEKEFAASPLLAKVLGTDILSIPRPNKPLTAAPSRKSPVWIIPHLKSRKAHCEQIYITEQELVTMRLREKERNHRRSHFFHLWKCNKEVEV